ncbi:hypothetical protein [Gemmatimonas sp.]|uniref:hypothetical protein n=1 Tax=Gemmatimonas sp. TaxID=1962908 RepID=UPI003983CFCF
MRLKESDMLLQQREPMGIVIADGGPGDRPSRFAAFVWGPVPDDDVQVPERAKELVASA